MAHGLSCSVACGIFPDQGPVFPELVGGFSTTAPPGKLDIKELLSVFRCDNDTKLRFLKESILQIHTETFTDETG